MSNDEFVLHPPAPSDFTEVITVELTLEAICDMYEITKRIATEYEELLARRKK